MTLPKPTTEAEKTLYRTRLVAAETAYDELITGKAVKKTIDQNGESVEFSQTNLSALSRYIRELREALDPILARSNAPKPIGFIF